MSSYATQRISAKNQVTLPRSASGLLGTEGGTVICGIRRPMRVVVNADADVDGNVQSVVYATVLLMTEGELQQTEQRIRDDERLSTLQRQSNVARLNGMTHRMSVDGQNRIVLPAHFMKELGLDRDVFMYSAHNGNAAHVWNPQDWADYNAAQDEDSLTDYFV